MPQNRQEGPRYPNLGLFPPGTILKVRVLLEGSN